MKKMLIAVTAAVVLSMALWLTLGAGAFGSKRSPTRPRVVHAAVTNASRPQGATVSRASLTSTKAVSQIRSAQPKSGGGENEGQGENENEGGGENSEPPGEPTPGHQDPNGQDVQHECPPNCDAANGELP